MFKKTKTCQGNDRNTAKSFIAPGAELSSAVFKSSGSVAINGSYSGRLEVSQNTELYSEGVIVGDISTGNALISGRVDGVIECEGFLEVTQTANIEGDIIASSIEVEHGAIINGTVRAIPKNITALVDVHTSV